MRERGAAAAATDFHASTLGFAALRAAGLLYGVLVLGWSLAFLLAVLVFEGWVFLTLAAAVALARERAAWSPGSFAVLLFQVLAAALFFGLLLGALAALMADVAFPGGEAWNELRRAWIAEQGPLVLGIVVALELIDAASAWRAAPSRSGAGIQRSMPLAFWRVLLMLALVIGVAQLAPGAEDARVPTAIGVALLVLFVDGLPAQATRILRLRRHEPS